LQHKFFAAFLFSSYHLNDIFIQLTHFVFINSNNNATALKTVWYKLHALNSILFT